MKGADALLISDYGYGLVTPALLELARAPGHRPPSIPDSHLLRFVRLTAATPNESEVEAALGISIGNDLEKLEWAGRTLLRKLKHRSGADHARKRAEWHCLNAAKGRSHIPIHGTDEVADVTGAGDTVIATFTLALAAGGEF